MGAALRRKLLRVQPADDGGEAREFWHVAAYDVRAGFASHICFLTVGSQRRIQFRFSPTRRFEGALSR